MCSRILREVLLDARGISRSLSLLSFAHASVAVDLIDYGTSSQQATAMFLALYWEEGRGCFWVGSVV